MYTPDNNRSLPYLFGDHIQYNMCIIIKRDWVSDSIILIDYPVMHVMNWMRRISHIRAFIAASMPLQPAMRGEKYMGLLHDKSLLNRPWPAEQMVLADLLLYCAWSPRMVCSRVVLCKKNVTAILLITSCVRIYAEAGVEWFGVCVVLI